MVFSEKLDFTARKTTTWKHEYSVEEVLEHSTGYPKVGSLNYSSGVFPSKTYQVEQIDVIVESNLRSLYFIKPCYKGYKACAEISNGCHAKMKNVVCPTIKAKSH